MGRRSLRSSATTALLVTASCGRLGFSGDASDATPPPPVDAAPDDAIFDDDTQLACGAPARFSIGAIGITALAAAPTPTGFAVFTVNNGNLAGSTYDWRADELTASAERVAIGTEVRDVIGAAAVDSNVIVASVYGATAPLGTRLYPLGGDMTMRGPAVTRGEIGGADPVANNKQRDAIAFLSVDAITSQVDARTITTLGDIGGAAHTVLDPVEGASTVSIAPAGSGYLVDWTSRATSPNLNRVALLDSDFGVVAGPVSTNTNAFDSIRGQAVWAPLANRYLVVWYEKNAATSDDVWFQIRGANLQPLTPATMLAPNGYAPKVASDGGTFWVSWIDVSAAPERLAAAKITTSGQVTMRPVVHSGGAVGMSTMVTRAGQSVLVWTETGGVGPDLYLDPMCP